LHWMKASTRRLWVSSIVWPHDQRVCVDAGLDPEVAKGILHIDAYLLHIAEEFRLAERGISFDLVGICASKVHQQDAEC
jgi:hypothetical protein